MSPLHCAARGLATAAAEPQGDLSMLLDRMEALLDAWSNATHATSSGEADDSVWTGLLATLLEQLARQLDPGDGEDAQARAARLAAALPEHAGLCERLGREQRALRVEIAGLCAELEPGHERGPSAARLHKRGRALLERIRQRELTELELLQTPPLATRTTRRPPLRRR
jgi:hypothetical protein